MSNSIKSKSKPVGSAQRPIKTRPDTTVGKLLRQAREQQGKTAETISAELKIPTKHLLGLEEGDLSVFPAEVYARGAFAKYAKYLGIEAQKTARAFQRNLTGSREYVPLRVHTPRSWLATKLTAHWSLAIGILGVALIVGSYIAWEVLSFVRLPDLRVHTPAVGMAVTETVTVAGTAAEGSTVRVNGAQVLLTNQGVFNTEIGVHGGVNVILVEATNAAGRTRTVEKHLLVPRET